MVVLKEFELSVNIQFLYFQTKSEHTDLQLAITKSYFGSNNAEVYAEKMQTKNCVLSLEQKVNPTRKLIL